MPYAKVELGTGNLLRVTENRESDSDYELNGQEMDIILHSKYGHAGFHVVNGVFQENADFESEVARQKARFASVTRLQAKIAIAQFGLLDAVEALIADPATDQITKIAWTDASTFERGSSTLQAMATALGLTDQQLDDLFTAASQVKV